VPAPWGFWTFWQYDDGGQIAGIPADVDVNQFNGSLAQLAKFQKSGQFPPSLPTRLLARIGINPQS